MSVFLTPIYTQTVGAGGVASVTFNNIPQSFTDLKLVISARSNQLSSAGGYAGIVRLNSVTSNVSGNQVYGDGTAIGANRWDAIYINIGASNYTANTFGTSEVYIPNYTRGTFKQVQVETYSENNGSGAPIGQASVSWGNTAPVTTVTILPYIGNFVEYSTFTLYGVANVYDTAAPAAPTIGAVTDLAGIASVAFTANDSGTGQTADNYSVFDPTIMSAPTYGNNSPIPVSVNTNSTYNNLAVTARNAVGSNASANPAGFTSYNNYAAIATFTGASGYPTFTNIPQYYKHLQLRILGRTNGSNSSVLSIRFYINNDNGANYDYHVLAGNGSTASSSYDLNKTNGPIMGYAMGGGALANVYGVTIIDLLDYTATNKNKTFRSITGCDSNNNTTGYSSIFSGSYRSFAPITSIQLTADDGGFGANSHIALYGIG